MIGAGNVGATCAFVLAQMKIGQVVMLDIYEGFQKERLLDMSQNANVLNYDGTITGTSNYEDIAGSSVVVVTSGFPRQPGMTREDLIGKKCRNCTTSWRGYQRTCTRFSHYHGNQSPRFDDISHAKGNWFS